ncbi:MAG: pyridoxamine 5'-phosphate oxidase family protein [Burkholderiales bacterium]|nr:pyridoxamine 5'-phosphate oxidase family protein [Burkholderiales bacterium]
MPTNNKNPPLLTEANAAFLPHRTSMNVAARDAQNRPAVARGLGCRVSADRRKLTVYLSTTHSAQVLQCLRENGAIAVAVTRPKTHETLQLKGMVLDIAPLTADDRAAMIAYQDSFVDELAQIGYRTEFTRTLLAGSEHCVAVVFEPTEMFNQTPGPKAGEKMGAQS